MGKRSREALGETFPEGKSKKRKQDGKDGKDGKERKKRLRELKKDVVGLPEQEEEDVQMEGGDAVEGEKEVLSKKAEKKMRKKKEAQEAGEGGEEKEEKVEEKAEKKKKDKKAKKEAGEGGEEKEEKEEKVEEKADKKMKDKKDKKTKKEGKEAGDGAAEGDAAAKSNGEAQEGEEAEAEGTKKGKAPRFIVFVGNLPYSATEESIRAHFAALKPDSVRCLNKRDDPTKCRGCAFVEFKSSTSMRTCLDKWHHSSFEDGVSKARRINVEMTAGGGGKTTNRMDKIKKKNEKLNVNRQKRIEDEKKGKKEKAEEPAEEHGGMHPSRRARMK